MFLDVIYKFRNLIYVGQITELAISMNSYDTTFQLLSMDLFTYLFIFGKQTIQHYVFPSVPFSKRHEKVIRKMENITEQTTVENISSGY